MTVAELGARMSSEELTEWMALWAIRADEAERARNKQQRHR